MKTNGKMAGYREYETYGESSLNDAPPFLLPDPTNPKLSKWLSLSKNKLDFDNSSFKPFSYIIFIK